MQLSSELDRSGDVVCSCTRTLDQSRIMVVILSIMQLK